MLGVVVQIGGIAGAGGLDAGSFVPHRCLFPQATEHISLAIYHMQRIDLSAKAVVVVGAAKMQLADGVDRVTGCSQAMSPAWHFTMVREGVVPISQLVHVAPGSEGCTRRNADRTVGVGARKPGAAGGQAVQVGRLHAGMAITPGDIAAVLVGEDEEKVCRLQLYQVHLRCLIG